VKPFVKSNKNDFVDAEAIAEAVERKNMRFVPIKTDDQLDLQAIHRVRDRLISRRTAVINQLRAFLLERGLAHQNTAVTSIIRTSSSQNTGPLCSIKCRLRNSRNQPSFRIPMLSSPELT
jgi:hypothetical protein